MSLEAQEDQDLGDLLNSTLLVAVGTQGAEPQGTAADWLVVAPELVWAVVLGSWDPLLLEAVICHEWLCREQA